MTKHGTYKTDYTAYFGGSEKMQEFIRQKMRVVLLELVEVTGAEAGPADKFSAWAVEKIKGFLAQEIIYDQDITSVVQWCENGRLKITVSYEDFFKLIVPEGKSDEELWQEIRRTYEPDCIPHPSIIATLTMTRAAIQMGRNLYACWRR